MLPLFKNLIEMAVVRAEEKGHKPLMTFLGRAANIGFVSACCRCSARNG